MTESSASPQQLLAENAALRARLHDAEETLRAIQGGEADAFVMSGSGGEQIHSMKGALEPYRVMVEAMGEGAVTLAEEGTLLYCNGHFAEWVKLPREQIVGRAMQGMIASQDRQRFAAMLPRGAQEVVRETLMLQAADGTQTSALFSMSPLPQSKGKVLSVVIADLSEVAAAAAARSRLALIVDSSDDAIVSTTLEGVVESWNHAAEQLFGYSAEEAIGRPLQTLTILPEQVDEVSSRFTAIRRGEHTGRVESMWRRKDGSLVEVSVIYSPILDPAGVVVGASINARNIAERKKAERLIEDTGRMAHVGGWELDIESMTVIWTEEVGRIHEVPLDYIPKLSEAIDFYAPEDRPVIQQAVQRAIDFGEPYDVEVQFITAKGNHRWIHAIGKPKLKDGKTIRLTGTFQDITERKRVEAELHESEQAFGTLSQNLPGMIYRVLIREGGRMQFFNAMTTQITGYAADELITGAICSIEPLILDEDRPGVEAEVMRATAEKRAFAVEYRLKHKDGGIRWVVEHGMPVYGMDDAPLYIDGVIFDITEQKKDEIELKLFRTLIDHSSDAIEVLEPSTLRFLDVNEAEIRALGYSREELLAMSAFDIDPAFTPEMAQATEELLRQEGSAHFETQHQRKDGSIFPVEVHSTRVELDKPYILSIARDITERKAVERAMQKYQGQLAEALEIAKIGYWEYEFTTAEFIFNDQYYLLHNITAEEAGGYRMSAADFARRYVYAEDAPVVEKNIRLALEAQAPDYSAMTETRILSGEGEIVWVEVRLRVEKDVQGNTIRLVGINQDITERKLAEATLHDSEERLRAIFDGAMDGIALADLETRRFATGNSALCHMLGYSTDEFVRLSIPDIHPQQDWPYVFEQFDKQVRGETQLATDMPVKRKDGSVFYADINTSSLELGGKQYVLGVFRDITERKEAEEALRRTNRALKTLSAGNLALVRATSEEELLQEVANVIVQQGGYVQAVVDYAEDNPDKSIIPKAWSGYEGAKYWAEQLSWDDTVRGQLPIAKAIRSGKTQICHDIAGDPVFTPWRDFIAERGYLSNIALPLSDGTQTFGGLCIYSSDANAFDDEEILLLEELANDLAYGIITLRTRKSHEEHAVILRQSLEQSIQTIAATVESRDAYTAGHQRRVSELATAIAREMGLPEEQVNGIHLAAIIHDLGKIRVPAEILSKPGKLTDSEFGVIKDHPQAAYDILKDVKFPWPIADIVWQHHEKLDGSGYPRGLKGEEILIESRIMTVADVVEAMSSHRPYRASLGIEVALGEIRRGRGSAYDPEVVDTCLNLFVEKGFEFSSQSS